MRQRRLPKLPGVKRKRGEGPHGRQLKPQPSRMTEFAPALPPLRPHTAPPSGYAPPEVGSTWKAGRFSGHDFTLRPDETLRCPATQTLRVQEQPREVDGS